MQRMQLSEMLTALRHETRRSPNAAMGVSEQEGMIYLLRRTQVLLAEDSDWRFLNRRVIIPFSSATQYVNYDSLLPFENVREMYARENASSDWYPLGYGIGAGEMNEYNSDAGEQSWPVRKWAHRDATTFEIWPIPSQSSDIMSVGKRALDPLVASGDYSTLDGYMIVLFAAAEMLASNAGGNPAEAGRKLTLAQQRRITLLRRANADKTGSFVLGGGSDGLGGGDATQGRPYIDFIPPA